MKKSEQFKIELKALMDKYGYKFICEQSSHDEPWSPPVISNNDDGSDPLHMLEVWDEDIDELTECYDSKPVRPESFRFAMDFLGEPEKSDIEAYVKALEDYKGI